jgi:hypothetical protein
VVVPVQLAQPVQPAPGSGGPGEQGEQLEGRPLEERGRPRGGAEPLEQLPRQLREVEVRLDPPRRD